MKRFKAAYRLALRLLKALAVALIAFLVMDAMLGPYVPGLIMVAVVAGVYTWYNTRAPRVESQSVA